ncbi:MAG: hypothetical protein KME45_23225 [Stenomitos rutilans HA7619-LM2]|jgi:hypothetical protein|nr:hypothetical protein [Stenomitos rutilans HA7619-LM2]
MPYQNIPDDVDGTAQDETLNIPQYLKEALDQQKERPTTDGKRDFRAFRVDSKQSWEEVAGEGTLAQKVANLVKASILLPRQRFQLPLATAYLLLPSAICNRVPILFSQGGSGSGKSTLGFLSCAIHAQASISSGSTFASIRNIISTARRWDLTLDVDYSGNEKNTALVWEDIKPEDISGADNHIFSLLKNGCERTGTITVAEIGGTNLVFKIFSPKLISSIHPIYARIEFNELVRRMLVIQHKPANKWMAEDFDDDNRNSSPDDLVDLADIEWDGLRREFRDYWEDEENLQRWVETSQSLSKVRNHGMSAPLYKMSRDLICCGVVTGVWTSKAEAIRHLADYWNWHRDNVESQSTATQKALKRFIEGKTAQTVETNRALVGTAAEWMMKPLEIDPSELKQHCEALFKQGELDTNVGVNDVNRAMNHLGWVLKPNSDHRNTWQLANG